MSGYDDDVKKAAADAFSNTSRLTTNRLGSSRPLSPSIQTSGSDTGGASASASRRSPSIIKNKDDEELFEQMTSATSVILSKRKKSKPAVSPVDNLLNTANSLIRSISPAHGGGGGVTGDDNAPPASDILPKNLDLANNDNSFHVIANLLVDYFQARVVDNGENQLLLQPSDKPTIERLLPNQARTNFIEAVQERLGNTPALPATPLQFLTLQCQELGLDQDDESNPLIAVMELTTEPVLIEVIPSSVLAETMATGVQQADPSVKSDMVLSTSASHVTGKQGNLTPLQPEPSLMMKLASVNEERPDPNGIPKAKAAAVVVAVEAVQPQQPVAAAQSNMPAPAYVDTDNHSTGFSIETGDYGPGADARSVNTANTESLARRQLLAELREASNLMAESVTPETAKFWRDHVLDLQARLRALHGEGSSVSGGWTSPTPEDILEKNRRLLSEFQQREQYIPTALSTDASKTAETPVSVASRGLTPVAQDTTTSVPSFSPGAEPLMSQPSGQDGGYGYGDEPIVDVVAPADLPGGYRFEAEIEGRRFMAVVPAGGVRQGDTFSCGMRELDSVAMDIPVGYWKDSVFNFFKFGCFHPVVLNSLFCPLILLAQITTRVNLDFIGRTRDDPSALSNRSVMMLVVFFWLVMNGGLVAGYQVKWNQGMELSIADFVALVVINGAMLGFVVFAAQSTRSSIREKFMIRESCCYDLEDLCCASILLPCTIAQMARHTANYTDHDAVCCSQNGLPNGVKVNDKAKNADNTYLV